MDLKVGRQGKGRGGVWGGAYKPFPQLGVWGKAPENLKKCLHADEVLISY